MRRRFFDGDGLSCAAAASLIVGACAAVLAPALSGGFLWDDYAMILQNPALRGLDLDRLRWMFSTTHMSTYQPLGWLAYAAIFVAAGFEPAALHAVSLALHAAAALALYGVASRLFAAAGRPAAGYPAAAAALWAVHPLQAASAAWVTQIPDQLATIFFLCSIYVYLGGRAPRRLLAAWLLFLASALCRWKGVGLPLVLLALDVYPLRRLRLRWSGRLDAAQRRVWKEKLPFAAISAAAILANSIAKASPTFSLSPEPATIAKALLLYPWKLLWPIDLLPIYEFRGNADPFWLPAPAAIGLLLAAAVAAAVFRRRWPAAPAALIAYAAAALPPALAVVGGTRQMLAHYAYLSTMGLFVAAAGGLSALGSRRARALGALGALALGLWWGAQSRRLCAVWADEVSFWTRALSIDGRCSMAVANIGTAMLNAGRYNDAWFWIAFMLRVAPQDDVARFNAHKLRRLAPALEPDLVSFWVHAAQDQLRLGRLDSALGLCAKALQARPRFAAAHETMAACLEARGEAARAARHLDAARKWGATPSS